LFFCGPAVFCFGDKNGKNRTDLFHFFPPYADGINSEMVCRFFRFFRFFFCERNAHCFDGVFPLSGFVTPMIRRVPLAMARAAGICVISTWCVSAAVLLLKKTKKFDIINQLYQEKILWQIKKEG
jgi:hypothetical protein